MVERYSERKGHLKRVPWDNFQFHCSITMKHSVIKLEKTIINRTMPCPWPWPWQNQKCRDSGESAGRLSTACVIWVGMAGAKGGRRFYGMREGSFYFLTCESDQSFGRSAQERIWPSEWRPDWMGLKTVAGETQGYVLLHFTISSLSSDLVYVTDRQCVVRQVIGWWDASGLPQF
jgi:hypothetical protein